MRKSNQHIRTVALGSGTKRSAKRHESDFGGNTEGAKTLGFEALRGGQRKPYSCPEHCPYPEGTAEALTALPLGMPLTIEDVAELLGCSVWTIRQKYLRQGLPYLRASSSGKFVFFREQVIDWILKRQTKGGLK
ncbi:MAG: hypothetical protein DMG65_19675 [Candidatus Angelobacter sp. Gp1-AA117]|nr:MAG: hypothetical protein DMG65_19675 [Candidatus Angelobacter sp. Gp1-AA117]